MVPGSYVVHSLRTLTCGRNNRFLTLSQEILLLRSMSISSARLYVNMQYFCMVRVHLVDSQSISIKAKLAFAALSFEREGRAI